MSREHLQTSELVFIACVVIAWSILSLTRVSLTNLRRWCIHRGVCHEFVLFTSTIILFYVGPMYVWKGIAAVKTRVFS